jgi:hypothetical protein
MCLSAEKALPRRIESQDRRGEAYKLPVVVGNCDNQMTILPIISMINRQILMNLWQNTLLTDFRVSLCATLVKQQDNK